MWVALLCWLLLACGPVLLGQEERAQGAGANGGAGSGPNVDAMGDAGSMPGATGAEDAGAPPVVVVRIRPVECGKCFELQAEAEGGLPPYEFEWEDGSLQAQRLVCVEDADTALTVVAIDVQRARSVLQTIHLQRNVDANCEQLMNPSDAGPPAVLCLDNPSFEGTPNAVGEAFDAQPWSTCTNPPTDNAPFIGNETMAITPGVPPPVDGLTFLALVEGQQVSQPLSCEIRTGVPLSLELDLAGVSADPLAPETEQVFLEIWGGLSVDCSHRELLWASRALDPGWQHFCVTLRPQWFTTQVTLRANADMTSLSPAYLLVDNLKPVDSCP